MIVTIDRNWRCPSLEVLTILCHFHEVLSAYTNLPLVHFHAILGFPWLCYTDGSIRSCLEFGGPLQLGDFHRVLTDRFHKAVCKMQLVRKPVMNPTLFCVVPLAPCLWLFLFDHGRSPAGQHSLSCNHYEARWSLPTQNIVTNTLSRLPCNLHSSLGNRPTTLWTCHSSKSFSVKAKKN